MADLFDFPTPDRAKVLAALARMDQVSADIRNLLKRGADQDQYYTAEALDYMNEAMAALRRLAELVLDETSCRRVRSTSLLISEIIAQATFDLGKPQGSSVPDGS